MLVALGRIWVSRCWVCENLKTGVWEFKFSCSKTGFLLGLPLQGLLIGVVAAHGHVLEARARPG